MQYELSAEGREIQRLAEAAGVDVGDLITVGSTKLMRLILFARAEERREAARLLLGVAHYGGEDNPEACWCEHGLGNPNAPTHDSGCAAVRAFFGKES